MGDNIWIGAWLEQSNRGEICEMQFNHTNVTPLVFIQNYLSTLTMLLAYGYCGLLNMLLII
jgi:hypothetical protein